MPFHTQWSTLEELRAIALAAGCTKAQFDEAVETVGDDPHTVANYLQRYALSWKLTNPENSRSRER